MLDSLFSHTVNPDPSTLKMTRLYDAFLCPENSFSLMMEGANTRDIAYYLSEGSAWYAVRAFGQYLALFHTGNAYTEERITDEYIRHKAEAFNKLSDNSLEDGGIELLSRAGNQDPSIEPITAENIIKLLPEDRQKRFESLVDHTRNTFEQNCGKIFRFLNKGSKKFYFLTKTHGDAHGNNFFYREGNNLIHNGVSIEEDSFYRISMIDFASIVRTYNGIGDPAEDVGRFLGFLWKWAARSQNEQLTAYESVHGLQEEFLRSYLGLVTQEPMIRDADSHLFERKLRENANFYKLRYYKAIFNSLQKKENRETKLKVLESWLTEHEGIELPVHDSSNTKSQERPWKPVTERVIHNRFPKKVEGFIESGSRGSEEKSYLTRLWKKFNTFGLGQATLSSTIAATGMGGVGKSSLALQYAHEALENRGYHLIWWLLSETNTSLLEGYKELAGKIGIPVQGDSGQGEKQAEGLKIREIVRSIEAKNFPEQPKWLLIYDNVPNPDFLKRKVPQKDNIDLLVTSRSSQGWGVDPINLDVFSLEEATKYLSGIIGIKDDEGHQPGKGKLTQLAEVLGCFPLALSHAAHYLRFVEGKNVPAGSIERYIEKIRSSEEIDYAFNPQKMDYESLIERTFRISSEEVSELAKELMGYCAYLMPDSIEKELFVCGLQNIRTDQEIEGALNQLQSLSLIKRTKNREKISIHRFLQHVIKLEDEKKDFEELYHLTQIFNSILMSESNGMIKHDISRYIIPSIQEDIQGRLLHFSEKKKEKILILKRQHNDLMLKYFFPKWRMGKEKVNASIIQQLVPDYMLEYGRSAIITALSWIKVPEQQELVDSARPLLKDYMGGCERASIINALKSIKASERQGVVDSFQQLITSNMDRWVEVLGAPRWDGEDHPGGYVKIHPQRASIITALGMIKASERQGIIDSARPLFTPNTDGYEMASTLKALSEIKASKRPGVIDSSKKLIKLDNVSHPKRIIAALGKIESSEHQGVVDSAEKLITPHMMGYSRASIVETLSKIQVFERQGIIDLVKQLDVDSRNQAFVIKSLGKVPACERQGIIDLVKQLNVDSRNQASIINSLRRIGPLERQGVVESALKLIPPYDVDGDNLASIIKSLSNVQGLERQEFIDSAKQLITPNMSADDAVPIVEALRCVEKFERRGVIDSTKLLIKPDMNGHEQASIIKALRWLEESERQGVTDSTKLLIKPDMNGHEQASIIKALKWHEESERQGVTDSANLLIAPDMDGWARASIIKALVSLKESERQGVIDRAKQFITPEMDGSEQASVIINLLDYYPYLPPI